MDKLSICIWWMKYVCIMNEICMVNEGWMYNEGWIYNEGWMYNKGWWVLNYWEMNYQWSFKGTINESRVNYYLLYNFVITNYKTNWLTNELWSSTTMMTM